MHIDRSACAWLIRRHVDPDAEFAFVADLDEVPDDATPFDMRGVDLGHHGNDCTFETILRRYDLADPEAAGFDVILRALSGCTTTTPCWR